MINKPLIIALEGLPGAGKTTIMTDLSSQFQDVDGVEQILPKDIPDKEITLDSVLISERLKTERCNNSKAKIVILDRYYQSVLAYHHASDMTYGESLSQHVQAWHQSAITTGKLVKPDWTIIIDIDPIVSVRRKDRKLVYDGSNSWIRSDFLESMRDYYVNLANNDEENCIFINGTNKINNIKQSIITLLEQKVGQIK